MIKLKPPIIKLIFSLISLVMAVGVLLVYFFFLAPAPTTGSKQMTLKINYENASFTYKDIKFENGNLKDILLLANEEKNLTFKFEENEITFLKGTANNKTLGINYVITASGNPVDLSYEVKSGDEIEIGLYCDGELYRCENVIFSVSSMALLVVIVATTLLAAYGIIGLVVFFYAYYKTKIKKNT